MLRLKKIGLIMLSTVMLLGVNTNASYFSVKASENVSASKNERIKTYTSTDVSDNKYNKFKTTLSVTFIEDEFDNQLTAFVSTEGSFIPSGLMRTGGYYSSEMYWPSTYHTAISSYDRNDKVKIVKSIPINQIKTSSVSETMGYSVGGNISAEKGKVAAEVSASYNASRSVKYDQPDYNTLLMKDSRNKAEWKVTYNENKDGYNRDSNHVFYGNELFMKSRLNNSGIKNLTDVNNLSTLTVGGFSPKTVIALKAPKDIKVSGITV